MARREKGLPMRVETGRGGVSVGRVRPAKRAGIRAALCVIGPIAFLLVGGAALHTAQEVRDRSRPAGMAPTQQQQVAILAPALEHRLQRLRRESLIEGQARLTTSDIDVLINWTREMRGAPGIERASTLPPVPDSGPVE